MSVGQMNSVYRETKQSSKTIDNNTNRLSESITRLQSQIANLHTELAKIDKTTIKKKGKRKDKSKKKE